MRCLLAMLLPAALSLMTKRVAHRPLTRRYLNRLFLTAEEAKAPQLTLDVDDRRAEHVKKIIWRGAPPPGRCSAPCGVRRGREEVAAMV